MRQLLPEWTPQWGVLLAWPDAHTDWADHLADAETCYLDILAALLDHEHVLLVCRNARTREHIHAQVAAQGIDLCAQAIECFGIDWWGLGCWRIAQCLEFGAHRIHLRA